MDDELLFRSATGMATEGEEASVASWRARSSENDAHYRDVVDVLVLAAEADDALSFQPVPGIEKLLGVVSGPRRRVRRLLRGMGGGWSKLLVAAASIATVAIAVPALRDFSGLTRGGSLSSSSPLGPDEFTTEAEPATVGLRDGTLVRMAPESRLRVHPRDDAREVSLTGRGYFAVARNPSRVFTIRSEGGTITVLGTRFDLTVEGENLRLIVIEGTVGLTVRGSMVEVKAGQMAQVVKGNLVPPVEVPDPELLVDWIGNFIVFQETPLRIVAAEVEKRHGVRIEFSDSGLSRRTVTAWFAGRGFDEVAEVICMVTHVRCTRVKDVLRMSPAK
jgi:ferric-dicitrate binding protein FerR (iron transport regulator)